MKGKVESYRDRLNGLAVVYTPDGRNVIFWGETYLATSDGYERLHHSTDELLTA